MATTGHEPSPPHVGAGSRLPLALALLLAGAVVSGLILWFGLRGSGPHEAGAAAAATAQPPGGCQLTESQFGYPDDFLSRALPPRLHPPLPSSGWHEPADPVAFDMRFHAIFHGYLLVGYRSDLGDAQRAVLRRWVEAHLGQRVLGSPDASPGAPLIELAEWNWVLRCADTVPDTAQLEDFAARRPPVPAAAASRSSGATTS